MPASFKNVIQMLTAYGSDQMLVHELEYSGKRFLEASGETSGVKVNDTTVALLVADAMTKVIDGYSGASYSCKEYLYEAVGYNRGGNHVSGTYILPRYQQLVFKVQALFDANKEVHDAMLGMIKLINKGV